MRQRVMIAMALSCNPKLLIADEPTTALDVTIQAQIMDLMRELRQKLNTIILITHDLGVVAGMCTRIQVMYAGRIIERGLPDDIYYHPKHPYTWGLLKSVPRLVPRSAPSCTPFWDSRLICWHLPKDANSGPAVTMPCTFASVRNRSLLKLQANMRLLAGCCIRLRRIWLRKEVLLMKRSLKAADAISAVVPEKATATEPLVQVIDLKKHFETENGLLKAVDGVSFHIDRGETLGLVGESGCGKTTVGRTITRLYEPTAGSMIFDGTDVFKISESNLGPFRSKVQMIFQDPYASLNPRMTVGDIIGEPIDIHKLAHGQGAPIGFTSCLTWLD